MEYLIECPFCKTKTITVIESGDVYPKNITCSKCEKKIGEVHSNPTISWPGSGGYWCRADINQGTVEIFDQTMVK